MALVQNPTYTCPDSGVMFKLRPIPPLNFDDFNNAYDEQYPPPKPPLIAVKVADKVITQPDSRDEYYLAEFARWNGKKEAAARHFMFYMGIENDTPANYQPDRGLFTGDLPPGKKKALWISDQLKTTRDIQGLVEAIQSLLTITEDGLSEEKKGTTPEPGGLISSNGTSNPDPVLSNSSIP